MDDKYIISYLNDHPESTVLDILCSDGRVYVTEEKKDLNSTLYRLAREGHITMIQPQANRKPKWRLAKPFESPTRKVHFENP